MMMDEIKRITVVGAGLMGHAIAQEFAVAGYDVCLHARSDASLDRALSRIQENLKLLAGLGRVSPAQLESIPAKLRSTTQLAEAVDNADLVIESVFEDLSLKQQLFAQIEVLCAPYTILASNTSSLMPSQLGSTLQHPERLLVVHYGNPPYLIPLVEMVPSAKTSEGVIQTIRELLQKIGKRPILLRKEVPGFVANRLQAALMREALWLVQHGVATAEEIDLSIKGALGPRWAAAGVFELLELAGWDLVLAVANGLLPQLAASEDALMLLQQKVERGELGVKSGQGFYQWTPEKVGALQQRIAHALINAVGEQPAPNSNTN